MAMVDADGSSLSTDSQLTSTLLTRGNL